MTSALCEETILRLADTYPFLRTEVLTTTAFGRPVRTLTAGEGDRKVIYSAAHHANEWITTPVLLKFAEDCKKYIPKIKFTVVDVLNKEEIAECQKIADNMGIPLRVREWIK